MIELNLIKLQQIRVKATPTRKAHMRKVKTKESEQWKKWQEHYRQNLFRPSSEPHEDMFSTVIMMSRSPEHAASKLKELQEKYPSSVGADLTQEFKNLYYKTRMDITKKGREPMTSWIQLRRTKHD